MEKQIVNRREVLTHIARAAYVAPLVYLTLPAHAAFAARGSGQAAKWGKRSIEKGPRP